jgi:hypothetical protein
MRRKKNPWPVIGLVTGGFLALLGLALFLASGQLDDLVKPAETVVLRNGTAPYVPLLLDEKTIDNAVAVRSDNPSVAVLQLVVGGNFAHVDNGAHARVLGERWYRGWKLVKVRIIDPDENQEPGWVFADCVHNSSSNAKGISR